MSDVKDEANAAFKREGFQILFQILLVNGLLGLCSTVTYFLVSDLGFEQRIQLLAVPSICMVTLLIVLITIKYKIVDRTSKGGYLTALSFISYIGFSAFYFDYDNAGIVIVMVTLYMIATQIIMNVRVAFSFMAVGILMSLGLFYFKSDEIFTVGIGYTTTMILSILLGGYATYKYTKLLNNYKYRMGSQLQQLKDSEERNLMIQRSSHEIMWDYNLETKVRTFMNMSLNEEGEVLSNSSNIGDWVADIHPEDAYEIYENFIAICEGKKDYFEKEFRQISKSGVETWYAAKVVSLKDELGKVTKIAGSYTLINDKKLKALQIEHLAYVEELTGLPSRSAFFRDLNLFLHESKGESEVVLFYIGLQNFKEFNSSLGHQMGDKLIQEVSKRLRSNLQICKLYQLTRVDFGVLYFGNADNAPMIAEQITSYFENPFLIGDRELFVRVLMGISVYPTTALNPETLLRNADTALYHCRKNNMIPYTIYTTKMTDMINYRVNLNNQIQQALDKDEFYMVYQPLIRVNEEKPSLYGFEALVRWNSPTLGLVNPIHFIPLAEESGLIMNIGKLAITDTCKFLKRIVRDRPDIIVSINLSVKQIAIDLFVPEFLSIVEAIGVFPRNICLEITETSFIESFEAVQSKLNELREKGFKIALDDFGTGYSSLKHLGELSVDTLKIDKSFTAKIDASNSDYYLIKSIIALANDLDINFIAEGVETRNQLELLKQVYCPIVQGYYFSKPLEAEKAIEYIKSELFEMD